MLHRRRGADTPNLAFDPALRTEPLPFIMSGPLRRTLPRLRKSVT